MEGGEGNIMDKKEELCKDRFEQAKVADVMHIYDNYTVPYRIFKKRKTESFI